MISDLYNIKKKITLKPKNLTLTNKKTYFNLFN